MLKIVLITPLTGAVRLVEAAKDILAAADEAIVTEADKQGAKAEAIAAEIEDLRKKYAEMIAEMEAKQATESGELEGDIQTAEDKVTTLGVTGEKVKAAITDLKNGLS